MVEVRLVCVCKQEMKPENESWWRCRSWPESSSSWDSCSRTWLISCICKTPLSSMVSDCLSTAWRAGCHPDTRGPHLWGRPYSTASCLTLEALGPESTSSSSGWRTEVWWLPLVDTRWGSSCVITDQVLLLQGFHLCTRKRSDPFSRDCRPTLTIHRRYVWLQKPISNVCSQQFIFFGAEWRVSIFFKSVAEERSTQPCFLLVFCWDFRASQGGPVRCPCLQVEVHTRPPEGHGWPPAAARTESPGPAGHGQGHYQHHWAQLVK